MQVPNGRFKQTKATKEMWKAKDKDSGGNPGLVVMGDQSCTKGRGFESWHCILDGHLDIFHIYLL